MEIIEYHHIHSVPNHAIYTGLKWATVHNKYKKLDIKGYEAPLRF